MHLRTGRPSVLFPSRLPTKFCVHSAPAGACSLTPMKTDVDWKTGVRNINKKFQKKKMVAGTYNVCIIPSISGKEPEVIKEF